MVWGWRRPLPVGDFGLSLQRNGGRSVRPAPNEADRRVSKQHPYIGAGTWSWNAAWASNVPQRLDFLDTSLCLTTNRDRLQLGECETADTWLFVQLDDAGVRIQPYASGEIRLRKGKLTAGLCVENTKDAGLQTRVCLPRGHVDAGRQNFFIQCSSDLQ